MKALLYIIAAALILSGCCTVRPGFPKPETQTIIFDNPPASIINVPVSVDFSNQITKVDEDLTAAMHFSGSQDDCNLTYSYSVYKQPGLDVSFLPLPGNPISFATTLGVGAGASYCVACVTFPFGGGRRCVVPKVGASCGQGGETPRRVRVSLSTPLEFNPDYTLKSKAALNDLYFIDPCRVTFLNIDISGTVASRARIAMPLGTIDERMKSITIRDPAQKIWDKLGDKIQIDEGLFLKIHPQQLSSSKITGVGQVASVTVGLQASPEITTDPSVPAVTTLPDLQSPTGAAGFNIFSDIKLDYTFLTGKLNKAFKDNEIAVLGKKIKIKSVQTYATNNRELIIKVFFDGDVCGHVYIKGVPVYDNTTREIKFTNLHYDAITSNILANVAAWLLEPVVLQTLEPKATVNIGAFIDQNTATINGYLNKEYPAGITTEGKVDNISIVPNNFQALPQFFYVRMHALGHLTVAVKL